jgi:hypothetical protein
MSPSRDIHLHLRNGVSGMRIPTFYCPAMGVALASLLSGRLPRQDVAVSGDLSVLGEFWGSNPALGNVEHVQLLYDQGFRRLVIGRERCMTAEVQSEVARRGIIIEPPPEDDTNFISVLPEIFGEVP